MNYRIFSPARIIGEITLPASKSISNRVLLINALCDKAGSIDNIADCDDTRIMRQALASDGDTVDAGAAGTAMRFLTAYFATREGRKVTIDGSERMRQRPVKSSSTPCDNSAPTSPTLPMRDSHQSASRATRCTARDCQFQAT